MNLGQFNELVGSGAVVRLAAHWGVGLVRVDRQAPAPGPVYKRFVRIIPWARQHFPVYHFPVNHFPPGFFPT
jgi:hypothetical protein